MGERSLRGSRLGSVSYETERNTAPIERQYAEYRCPSGHLFTVPFADDAELPDTWECKFDGGAAKLVGGAEPAPKKVKPPRTHWDMLLERRSERDHFTEQFLQPRTPDESSSRCSRRATRSTCLRSPRSSGRSPRASSRP